MFHLGDHKWLSKAIDITWQFAALSSVQCVPTTMVWHTHHICTLPLLHAGAFRSRARFCKQRGNQGITYIFFVHYLYILFLCSFSLSASSPFPKPPVHSLLVVAKSIYVPLPLSSSAACQEKMKLLNFFLYTELLLFLTLEGKLNKWCQKSK